MGAWLTKMGPWVGLVVPDMVGVVNIVPSGFNLMQEGGGSAGTVCGHNLLMLGIASLAGGHCGGLQGWSGV